MKANKLTQGHNLMWESSRMMLPEHKEVLQQHQKELNRRQKPILDEQEIELMERKISSAIQLGLKVELHLFDPYDTTVLKGIIVKKDDQYRRIKLQMNDETEWIPISELVHIHYVE